MKETAYCMKCKQARSIAKPKPVWRKDGKPGVRGKCSVCNGNVYKPGRIAAHDDLEPFVPDASREEARPKPVSMPAQNKKEPAVSRNKAEPKKKIIRLTELNEQPAIYLLPDTGSRGELKYHVIYSGMRLVPIVYCPHCQKQMFRNMMTKGASLGHKCHVCHAITDFHFTDSRTFVGVDIV